MVQNHLARLAAPKSWTIARKENRWTARPTPGPHGLNNCITINLLLKGLLNHAKTTREVKTILNNADLLVDNVVRKDYKFPVGLMDVVSVPKLNENYRMVLDTAGRLELVTIGKDEVHLKLLQIVNKCIVKKGKLQLTFHDGRTILVDKFEGKVGDSVLFDLSKKSIVELLKMEKGALMLLTAGKHVGSVCKVKDILKTPDLQMAKVVFEENGEDIITLMDYAFVVGKDKPLIKIESENSKKVKAEKAEAKAENKSEEKVEKKKTEVKSKKADNKEGKR